MPVVNSCNYNGLYEAVSTRFTAQPGGKGCKNERSDKFLSSNSKKAKELVETKDENIVVNEICERKISVSNRTSQISENLANYNNSVKGSRENNLGENKPNSIVSGSQRIRELQELYRELSKSSYEASKSLDSEIKPRKPTMETIKSAIGKSKLKQNEKSSSKSVGTSDKKVDVVMNDASTSTNRSKVKKKKKKKLKKTTTEHSKTNEKGENRQSLK